METSPLPMKALIKVGYGCNDHCTFCHTLDVRHIDGSAAEVEAKIDRAKKLGHTMVVLSGGEPTIRPELMRWAARVARLDMDFGLVTNGRLLAYPKVVEQLLALRLRYVYLSLHGGSARIHDRLVRSQAFEESYGALRNLSGKGIDLTVNCVVTKQNVEHLRELVDAVAPYPDAVLKMSMVEPKGGGDRLFDHLIPRVAEAAAKVRDAIEYAGERLRVTHGAFPLCLMGGYEHLYDDLKTDGFKTMVEIGEGDFFPVDDRNLVQPEQACRGCALRGPCPGLYRGYDERFGAAELTGPVTGRTRSNSFNYRFEGVLRMRESATSDAGDSAACPLRGPVGVTPWDRGRDLFVRSGPRIARYRADGRDFSDAEIEAIKHGAGQLYLDVSDKPAPDDFARDLRQLRRSAMCTGCPEAARCTGMFEPIEEDVFSRDDARVRALLAGLEGNVLDVGCGEGPYEDVLAPLARSGRIHYVGIDPDAARIAALRVRWPWAELSVAAAESFVAAADQRFDHVLLLRSWNHLSDPALAVRRLLARLAPGGTLTVVDNVAFGLLRSRPQVERAEGSTAGFEHYRNDGAGDAHRVLASAGFEVLERREVRPDTSNQWLLRYRAPAGSLHAAAE